MQEHYDKEKEQVEEANGKGRKLAGPKQQKPTYSTKARK